MTHRFSFPQSGDWAGQSVSSFEHAESGDADFLGASTEPLDCESSSHATFFRPEGYEPNYAYPLLIWFHEAGEDESILHRLMPEVSERNVVGLSLRGERLYAGGGYGWAETGAAAVGRLKRLQSAVQALRAECHLHTERIVLAGVGAGALAAAHAFFARPDWFGGLALFNPPTRPTHLNLTPIWQRGSCGAADSSADLAGRPALLGATAAPEIQAAWQSQFTAAELAVTVSPEEQLTDASMRHLNRWLLNAVCGVA